MYLKDIITLIAGPNRTRLSPTLKESDIYSVNSIDDDLSQLESPDVEPNKNIPFIDNGVNVRRGDLIISSFRKKAAVVTSYSENKILTSNFVRCEYNSSKLDPWYFCYFMNESEEFRKQTQKEGLKATSPMFLNYVEITLPPLELQIKIGKAYKALCKYMYLQSRRIETNKKLVLSQFKKVINQNNNIINNKKGQ